MVPKFCAFGFRIKANTNILRHIVFLNPGFLPLKLYNINANTSTSAPAASLFQPSNLSLPSMVQSFTLSGSAVRSIARLYLLTLTFDLGILLKLKFPPIAWLVSYWELW